MEKTKVCIFDLDGTLLNTLPAIAYFCNTALAHFGLSTFPEDRFRYFAGNGAKNLVKNMLDAQGADTEALFEPVYTYYNEIYNANPTKNTAPYPEIPALLATLQEKGIALAVLSNKPHYAVCETVKGFFPDIAFSVVQGQTEALPLKPSPEGIFRILSAVGAKREECLYSGDSDVDMKTALAAGVFSVGAAWGFRGEKELTEAGASAVAANPLALLDWVCG